MKRITLIASGADLAGGEKSLLDIVRFLVAEPGWEPFVIVPEAGRLKMELTEMGVRADVVSLPTLVDYRSIKAMAAFIVDHGAHLVHAHGSRAALYARPAARRARIPCIYTVHGVHFLNYHPIKRLIYIWVERWLRRVTARTVFVCRSDMSKALKAGFAAPGKSVVIYNGVVAPPPVVPGRRAAIRQELGVGSTTPLVLNVGRFHFQKGHEYLIQAAAVITKERPDVRFVLVGDGDTLAAMQKLVVELNLGGVVLFAGPRDDVADLMAAADVFALPSRWEGLPYVLLEAALVGLPAVAADVDGVPEVVIDGQTGLLVAPHNSAEMASAITRLIEDEDERRSLGEAVKDLVATDFSLATMYEKMIALYDDVSASSS